MKKTIIICDDELGVRESLKLILGDHYELILVDNGVQCLKRLKENDDIKLLMLDIKMPRISGLDILRTIKEAKPGLKVIIISGYKSVETAGEAVRLGASGYMVKPFKAEEVLAEVQKVLNA